ncbi:MAG: P-II family nitrogen regulator [Eubacteriales bacterium]|nr:P-II family nitrogen regulator [Eubacteriales bacterium]
MNDFNYMMSITNRNELDQLLEIYRENGVAVMFVSLGRGTAAVDKKSTAVIQSIVSGETWRKVKNDLIHKLQIDLPDKGIVFTIPLSSAGGMKQLKLLMGSQEIEVKEESVLKGTKYELVLAIANAGHSDEIMNAARAAGAKGGTVVHAKGTGREPNEEFLGITIGSDKEMIYIVVRANVKNAVMKAIMDNCGMKHGAKSVVLSLPVTDTAGMRFYEMQEEEEETADGE